jgi:putative FmdB family regulatory protein
MPLYEYECTQCKRHTEKIQKFSDPEITQCPHCGGLLERVISAPAVSFKGGGWYADGYGNAKPAAAKTEGKSDSSTSAAKSAEGSSSSSEASSSPGKDTSAASPATGSGSSPASAAAAPAASTADKK